MGIKTPWTTQYIEDCNREDLRLLFSRWNSCSPANSLPWGIRLTMFCCYKWYHPLQSKQSVSQSVLNQLCSYLSVFSWNFPPFPIVFLADSVFMWLLLILFPSPLLTCSLHFPLRLHHFLSSFPQLFLAMFPEYPSIRWPRSLCPLCCPSVAQSMARSDLLSAGLLSALLPPTPTPTPVPLSLCLPVSFSRLCSAPVSPSFCWTGPHDH